MKPFATQNQMSLGVPQANSGLNSPWGNAMFNMPVQPTAMNFSVSRAASTDPVQNMMRDMNNPMGGMTFNFAQQPMQAQAPQESPLKRGMLAAPPAEDYPVFDRSGLSNIGFPGYSGMSNIGFPGYNRGGRAPFQLRGRMTEPMVFA